MSIVDRMVGMAVSNKLKSFTAENAPPPDYPKADLKKLEAIATKAAESLPALSKDLLEVLPKKLPAQSALSKEAQTNAMKVGEHLLNLVPMRLEGELEAARDDAPAFSYDDARAQFGKMRSALKASPHFKAALPDALVAFAASKGVTPDELEVFAKRLEDLREMLPLVKIADTGIEGRLAKLEKLLAG